MLYDKTVWLLRLLLYAVIYVLLFGELELVFLFDPSTSQVAMFSEISKVSRGAEEVKCCFVLNWSS